MIKNNNGEKRIRKKQNKTYNNLSGSTSTGEDKKKLSLLLKEVTTLKALKPQSFNLYLKRDLLF